MPIHEPKSVTLPARVPAAVAPGLVYHLGALAVRALHFLPVPLINIRDGPSYVIGRVAAVAGVRNAILFGQERVWDRHAMIMPPVPLHVGDAGTQGRVRLDPTLLNLAAEPSMVTAPGASPRIVSSWPSVERARTSSGWMP